MGRYTNLLAATRASTRDGRAFLDDVTTDLNALAAGLDQVPAQPVNALYVDTVNGSDSNSGASWSAAKVTMAAALALATSGGYIYFRGRVKEQCTTPVNVMDVTIVGVGTRPRHADTAPAGGNLSPQWQVPASPTATTPLLSVIQQGWRFVNILFDAPADDACVELLRNAGAGDLERDASHASFYGCRFVGGQEGILDSGGNGHILVEDSEFHDLTTAIKSVTGAGVGQALLRSTIRGCRFRNNTNDIISASQELTIADCIMSIAPTKSIDLHGGVGKNVVTRNTLPGTYGDTLYTEGTSDCWNGNAASTGFTAAVPA